MLKSGFIILAISLVPQFLSGQSGQPFSYLDKIEIKAHEGTSLHLVASQATLINKKRSELKKDDIFYAEECEGEYTTLAAICKIDNKLAQKYAIFYSTCPNPEFVIYNSTDPEKILKTINADQLFINSSGHLYSSGGEGTFDTRKKYTLTNGEIKYVQQPFYYVGLKSKTLNPITIYGSKKLENEVAKLPVNYDIEVILSENVFNETEALYLVKTSFGLLGWARLKAGQYKAIDVKGLIYKGD